MRFVLALVLVLSGAACGGESGDSSEGPADAGGSGVLHSDAGGLAPDGGSSSNVTAGTGIDMFEPLTAGQTLHMIEGPQGGGRTQGYHIWAAARAVGIDPRGVKVTIEWLIHPSRTSLGLTQRMINLAPNGDGFAIWAVAVPFSDCCLAKNADLILRARIEGSSGLSGGDEIQVRGGPGCYTPSGVDLCP